VAGIAHKRVSLSLDVFESLTSLMLNSIGEYISDVTDDGKELANDIAKIPCLRSLRLWYRRYDADGLFATAGKLTELQKLKKLDLTFCSVSDGGAVALASMLAQPQQWTALTKLSLRGVQVEHGGIARICSSLLALKGLVSLNVSGFLHEHDDRGASLFLSSLQTLTALEFLDISENVVLSWMHINAICAVLAKLRQLQWLSIRCCNLMDSAMIAIMNCASAHLDHLNVLFIFQATMRSPAFHEFARTITRFFVFY